MLKATKSTKPKKHKKKHLADKNAIEISDDEHSTTSTPFTPSLFSTPCPFREDVDIEMEETEDNVSSVYTKKKGKKTIFSIFTP